MNDPVPGQYLYYYLNQNFFYLYFPSGPLADSRSNRVRLYHRLRHQRACSFFLGHSHPGIRRCLELLITNIDGGECLSSFGDLDPSFKFSLDNTWSPTPPLVSLKDWSTLVPPASSETLELSSPGPHLVPFCGLLLTKQKPAATCHHGDLKR